MIAQCQFGNKIINASDEDMLLHNLYVHNMAEAMLCKYCECNNDDVNDDN